MIGPVLDFELLRGSRSNGLLLLRRIYTGWLVVQLLFFYWLYLIQSNLLAHYFADVPINTDAAAAFVNSCASTLITQQFILLALCTPALTAGAITDEKTRGTLQYLLTADVTGWEIVTSKLFGRIWQVLILCLAVLPMLCFLVGLGGYHPIALAVPFVLVLVPVFAIASASLLASVWCRQTRDAVLMVYIGLLAASGLAAWLGLRSYFDPLHVMESAWDEEVNLAELSKRAGIWRGDLALHGFGISWLGRLAAPWRLFASTSKRRHDQEAALVESTQATGERRSDPVEGEPDGGRGAVGDFTAVSALARRDHHRGRHHRCLAGDPGGSRRAGSLHR